MKLDKIISIKPIGTRNTSDLHVLKNHNYIANGILVHNSGYGKGLADESIIEEFYNAGYTIICIADPKDELELAYAMFEPKERYHLEDLQRIGKKKKTYPVKLYHPFTFELPKTDLPDMNFFTIPFKQLGRKEWSLLVESQWDTDTIKLLINASHNISNEDGLYDFLHYIQQLVRGTTEKRKVKPEPKNFYLSTTSGTLKSIQDISNFLQPFKHDYFLSNQNSPHKLDWKNILSDQKHYHVFVSNWIKDPKLKEFVILYIFNQIIQNKAHATRPILIFIPEIRFLTPFRPEGYQLFLARGIKDNLSMMRSMGKGMSALFDTQVFCGVDEEVANSATTTLFGELGGARDTERVSKAMNYKRNIREQLSKMRFPNSYLIGGKEEYDPIRIWLPSHMHCEPNYNFFNTYKKTYPEKMKNYKELIDTMKKDIKSQEEKVRDRIKKRQDEEKKKIKKANQEKETKNTKTQELNRKIQKAEQIETKSIEEKMKLCYEAREQEGMSYTQIKNKYNLGSHNTAKKYYENHKKKLEEQDSKNYDEEAINEWNKESDDPNDRRVEQEKKEMNEEPENKLDEKK